MKKILIINGHPNPESYCTALARAYKEAALASGHEVKLIHLGELNFNLNLANGYARRSELEPDLLSAWQSIQWAAHIVIVHPVWWGSVPALLKGFFDRLFLPGMAFKYREKGLLWDKLLTGRTARIIYTTDTPVWFYHTFYLAPSVNQVKKRILNFCGITPVKVTGIGPIRGSSPVFRQQGLDKISALGSKGD